MEIAAIRGKSGARLTARHWLLDGDPRLSEMQVNGRSNRGRRFEDRKGGGRWSVVGAVPTISKAAMRGELTEAKSPPTADKPKARPRPRPPTSSSSGWIASTAKWMSCSAATTAGR